MWQQARPATNFPQRDPDNGQPASERTEVRVVFDQDRRAKTSPWHASGAAWAASRAPACSTLANVQFDSESGQVGWQLRFRWIQKPGNDLFFIWTQNWWDDTVRGFKPLDRRGAAKIVRTFRF